MSDLPLVEVRVGGTLLGHFTEAGHATVLAVPSAINCKVNEYAIGEAGGFANVKFVIELVRGILKNVPVVRFNDTVAAAVTLTNVSVTETK